MWVWPKWAHTAYVSRTPSNACTVMNIRIVLSLFALLCVGGTPIFAYPGKVALAYPVADIAVDGDLSDWPEGLVRYPILHNADGADLFGEGDFQGEFIVGYNESENALYVAVDIRDDSIVLVPADDIMSQPWNAQDGCELYLFSHKPGEDAPTQYRLWGEELGMYGPGDLEEVQANSQWREDGYRIEWRIDIAQASGQRIELRPGIQLGFDLSVWDRDERGEPSWMAWSKGIDKYQRADRLGNVVLVPAGAGIDDVIAQLDAISEGREEQLGSPLVGGMVFSAGYQMFFSGVLLSITFLHFLLFLFNRSTRANLFYALYTAAIGGAIFSGLQLEFHSYMDPLMVRVAKETAILVINLFGLVFLFALFGRVPKRFYFELVVFIITAARGTIVLLNFDSQGMIPFNGAFEINRLVLRFTNLFLLVETVLVLIGGVRRRQEGAWIIGIGFIVFAANVSPLIYETETDVTALYWVLIPLVSMSVYLARSVAQTNQELQQRLLQVEELSAKTQEQYEQIQEQNAQIQEANRLKSDFLARMSHDLRTPMNAIIGYTRILLRKSADVLDTRQYKNLQNVQISASALLELINDILDLSKIEAGRVELKPAEVDLKILVEECARSIESLLGPGVELRCQLEELPLFVTDEDRVRRALMNLLSNAVKFTEVGHVEVFL
ncbi:MAG: signal transduction histidine kinase, partial [Candidatus Latescibacterota bacterium]